MTTKQEYIDALGQMEELYYNFDNCISAMNKFKKCVNLLTGLVNECFEEKTETNLEHFKDAIIDNEFNSAVKNGKVEPCGCFKCDECSLYDHDILCCEMRVKWLLCKYEKQKYKLSQFEYDLLNAYKVSGMRKSIFNYSTLLGLQEKGYFKEIDTSIPIHEILDNCEVIK